VEGWWAASYVVLWFLVIGLCLIVVGLARQVGTLHLRLGPRGALELDDEGPPLGEAPVPIDAFDTSGAPVNIGGPGEAQLLLFVSPTCRSCAEVLPSLSVVARTGTMTPILITDAEMAAARTIETTRINARVVSSPEAVRLYEIPGTPYAVALDRTGVVRAKGTANNLEQMEGLVDTARRRLSEPIHERGAT
jgi:methylamine dehydrogenase accessory protein MauD